MAFVSINNLQVSFGKNIILDNFNLDINESEIYAIIGPSGCGKSTLLKSICRIIKPQSGEIRLKNEPVNVTKHNIGYIPQHYGLLDWMKIRENITIGVKIKHNPGPNFDDIIKKLDIGEWLDRYPRSLSGGQKQRVALARAWMLNPDLLLMDEPFSALDSFTSEKSKALFVQLWKEQKTTTIFVTHNVMEAVQLAKNIVILSGRPAQPSQIIRNPLFEKGVSRNADDFYFFSKEISNLIQTIWKTGE